MIQKDILKALEKALPNISIYRDGKSFIETDNRGAIISDVYVQDERLNWPAFIELLHNNNLDITFKK